VTGVITATCGNHGQSVAFAASRVGLRLGHRGSSREQPREEHGMRTLGATLIEYGADFQEAYEHSAELAEAQRLHLSAPSQHATCRRCELRARTVRRRCGPGCRVCPDRHGFRDLRGCRREQMPLGLRTESHRRGGRSGRCLRPVIRRRPPDCCDVGQTIADGMACSVPDRQQSRSFLGGVSRMPPWRKPRSGVPCRYLFTDTHNVAEGAGAAALAALLQERRECRAASGSGSFRRGRRWMPTYSRRLSRAASTPKSWSAQKSRGCLRFWCQRYFGLSVSGLPFTSASGA